MFVSLAGGSGLPPLTIPPSSGRSSPPWLSISLEGAGGRKLLFPALLPQCFFPLLLHLYFFTVPSCLEIAACGRARTIRASMPVGSRLNLVQVAGETSGWSCMRTCTATQSTVPFCKRLLEEQSKGSKLALPERPFSFFGITSCKPCQKNPFQPQAPLSSKQGRKKISLKINSLVISREKWNDVMASAGDPVFTSHCVWFPRPLCCAGPLPPAPHSTLLSHVNHLLPSRFFLFYREISGKRWVKPGRQGYSLAPEILGVLSLALGTKEAMRNGNYEKRESGREEKREREEKRGSLTWDRELWIW